MTQDFSILSRLQVPWVGTKLPITKKVLTYYLLGDPCFIKLIVSETAIPDWITFLRSLNRTPFNQRKAITNLSTAVSVFNKLLLCEVLESDCQGLGSWFYHSVGCVILYKLPKLSVPIFLSAK